VCAGCPVRAACLEHALRTRERFGVWGGLTEEERQELLAPARVAARAGG
jgi:WhiB family transcriptional regulator, redox-sensing transcriptional regulator